jgi:hypothetical protein
LVTDWSAQALKALKDKESGEKKKNVPGAKPAKEQKTPAEREKEEEETCLKLATVRKPSGVRPIIRSEKNIHDKFLPHGYLVLVGVKLPKYVSNFGPSYYRTGFGFREGSKPVPKELMDEIGHEIEHDIEIENEPEWLLHLSGGGSSG